MTASAFMEATDERGQALLVRCDSVAAVREIGAGQSISDARATLVLKGGDVIAVQTEFATVIERLKCATQAETDY